MTNEQEKPLPPFEPVATAKGFLSDSEIDRLITENAPLLTEGKLGAGGTHADVRRSQVAFLSMDEKHRWLYERIWLAAKECNRMFFCVDIQGVEPNIQLARYDHSDQGFYNWHTDFAGFRPLRKISISIQLSGTEDYDGGDLELQFGREPHRGEKAKGTFIAFPSFMLHRVTPVTRGTRWSLVAWILGPRWR
jgi:predicted 2-oxoglutarate/Fe(II)-dependent dioxygenase YbiX